MIDEIRALEELTCKARARQAALSVRFDASQRSQQAARGVPANRQGRGVAEQIALARRESPHRAKRRLSMAKILGSELPHTRAAFAGGHITEWKATIVTRETACLTIEDRLEVDRRIAADPARIEAMGDHELEARVKELAYELDARSWVGRRARAEADRHVTCRAAPDVMTYVSALLPVKQGVAVYAALRAEADRLAAVGDPRSRGQIMADTLYQRTVAPTSSAGDPQVGVVITVVVPDTVLLGGDGAAYVDGYGPIPGDLARELATDADALVALRRLYSKPETGCLTAMDARTTSFPQALATFIRLRDQICRTPWCDAPIRHSDHVKSLDEGGETSGANGQGCVRAATTPSRRPAGWSAPDQDHGTPSRPPPRPGIGTDRGHPRSVRRPRASGAGWTPSSPI